MVDNIKHVFIDTNILLSFYDMSTDDLNELDKLINLIKNKKLILYKNDHLISEYLRNRTTKIKKSLDALEKLGAKASFPVFTRCYAEYSEIKNLESGFNKKFTELLKKIREDILNNRLKADTLINSVLGYSTDMVLSPEIITKSEMRAKLAKPPGKSGSLGDAIHWELLKNIPIKNDVYLISADSDFFNILDSEKSPNEYLTLEWNKLKSSRLHVYKKLSCFFKENSLEIHLSPESESNFIQNIPETEADRLIDVLAKSRTFSRTHETISLLENIEEFTANQAMKIISAYLYNSQICGIICDEDVKNFIKKILESPSIINCGQICEENISEIKVILEQCPN